jgi:voltage-gated potassium channel
MRTREKPLRKRTEAILEWGVVLGALATIPLTIAQEAGANSWVVVGDWIVWVIFLVEYVVMIGLADNRSAYAKSNLLSVAVIVLSFPALPTVLALTRLARLTRLTRIIRVFAVAARGARALGQVLGRRGFLYVAGVCGILILTGAAVMLLAEPDSVPRGYWDAVWWAVVTTTTVGYGDISPVSPLGRVIGVILMFAGLGLVATLAASIAAYFVEQDDAEEQADVEARLTRIEALLQLLTEGQTRS